VKAFFVTKRLAFGSAITSWQHVEQLKRLGITHVINLRYNKHGKKLRQFRSLWLPFSDDKKPRPRWFYAQARSFFNRAFRRSNAKVFVMCRHGICRSPSLTYFFLRLSGESANRSKALVLEVRPCARIVLAYCESGERFLEHHGWHRKQKSPL
jgi:protein tyrosine phosphatase (PTP) superfamily phosphohydrolase (DUF442 family)